jgi:hypothetical protein
VGYIGGLTTFRSIVKTTGHGYKKVNNRNILIESPRLQSLKIKFVTKSWPVTAPGSQGVFRGRGRGFGFLKKWAPGSYCLELVVACPAAGTSAQILLVEGK